MIRHNADESIVLSMGGSRPDNCTIDACDGSGTLWDTDVESFFNVAISDRLVESYRKFRTSAPTAETTFEVIDLLGYTGDGPRKTTGVTCEEIFRFINPDFEQVCFTEHQIKSLFQKGLPFWLRNEEQMNFSLMRSGSDFTIIRFSPVWIGVELKRWEGYLYPITDPVWNCALSPRIIVPLQTQ